MTNVPETIREALADAYRLFDVSFPMTGTAEEWQQYWGKVADLVIKYGDGIPLLTLMEGYAEIIEHKGVNCSKSWKKNEDYPYPKTR